MRYKPTRAATNASAVENGVLGGDGEEQEGAADSQGGEGDAGDVSGGAHGDESDAVAPGGGFGAAKTGLGESMAAFFQRGAMGPGECVSCKGLVKAKSSWGTIHTCQGDENRYLTPRISLVVLSKDIGFNPHESSSPVVSTLLVLLSIDSACLTSQTCPKHGAI